MVNKNLYTLLVCLLLAGCDLIDYHPTMYVSVERQT